MDSPGQARKTLGVIDLGTNSALLVVGSLGPAGALEVVRQEIRIPRIGQGLQASGRIDEESHARAIECLEELLEVAEECGLGVEQVQVVATAALRRATNGPEIGRGFERSLGCAVRILSGPEEARLSHLAVATDDPGTLAIDVGGGSSEVVWQGGTARRSLDLGALTVAEQFGGNALDGSDSFPVALDWVREQFCSVPEDLAGEHPVALIGGSAVNLACLVQGLDSFDHLHGDRVWAETSAVMDWAARLWRMSLSQRRQCPIERDRAGFLPAGLLCLGAALERLGASGGWTRTVGLAHGALRCQLEAARP